MKLVADSNLHGRLVVKGKKKKKKTWKMLTSENLPQLSGVGTMFACGQDNILAITCVRCRQLPRRVDLLMQSGGRF